MEFAGMKMDYTEEDSDEIDNKVEGSDVDMNN